MPKISLNPPAVRTLPGHLNCRHRYYGLSCDTYEQMLQKAGQRCEICGCLPMSNTAGKLFIDHENKLGRWAVRGLLCHRCNSLNAVRPDWNVQPPEGSDRYLADPWYLRQLASRGMSTDLPVEPDSSAEVVDGFGCVWKYAHGRWRAKRSGARGRDWTDLVDQFGPIGLTITFPA